MRGEFGTKVYYGDGTRIDLLRLAGAETAKAILFCNDNGDGDSTRDGDEAVSRPFRRRRSWSAHSTGVHLMAFDGLDVAFAQREMFESAVTMGRAALSGRASSRAKSIASTSNIGCAIASGWSCRPRPATCTLAIERTFGPDQSLPKNDD